MKRVVVLRGHNLNPWDVRPLARLSDEFDVVALRTGSNLHRTEGLGVAVRDVRTPRDTLPAGRLAGAAAYALGERYLGLRDALAGAAIVHAAELGTWFSAQAAALRDALGFKLVLTVWETLPWGATYRWPRERGYRRAVLGNVDLYLAATERAAAALALEGVEAERIEVCAPGIDVARFAVPRDAAAPLVLSAGRLVWEKGHQDVLRAVAALQRGIGGPPRPDVRALIVGDGPERPKLQAHATELGIAGAVEFRATVPYDEMPALYARASALVLASLPTRGWEEQFGMVLVEAMAAGTPIVAADSGAIGEVLGGAGTLVQPGDWRGIAAALRAVGEPAYDAERLRTFSSQAAAERLRAAYRRVLSR